MATRKKEPKEPKAEGRGEKANPPTRFELWWEEAWEGWISSVIPLVLLAIGYLFYKFDLVSEHFAGVAVVLIIIGGSIISLALPVWSIVRERSPGVRALFITTITVALVATLWPSLRVASPPAPLAETHLGANALTQTVKTGTTGPYEITVSGHFKKAGMQEAAGNYTLNLKSGNQTEEIDGTLSRTLVQVHGRRGGGSSEVQEQTEHSHRLQSITGSEITFSTDGIDDALSDGLTIAVRSAGPNPLFFWIFGGLACLVAIGFDARTTDAKGRLKTYLAAGTGIALAFAIVFPYDASPHSTVKPAVSALLLALVIGGLGGALLSVVARALFGPKISKVSKVKRTRR